MIYGGGGWGDGVKEVSPKSSQQQNFCHPMFLSQSIELTSRIRSEINLFFLQNKSSY